MRSLRVRSDVAAVAQRVQALPEGDYALHFSVDTSGRISAWRVAEFGGIETISLTQ